MYKEDEMRINKEQKQYSITLYYCFSASLYCFSRFYLCRKRRYNTFRYNKAVNRPYFRFRS